jgi:DNA-binding response OmpR family regulator
MTTARALIVHDDPAAAGELADALSASGFAVDVVDSGLAAIRQIWEQRYDRVLIDSGLRGMRPTALLGHLAVLAPAAEIRLISRSSRAA